MRLSESDHRIQAARSFYRNRSRNFQIAVCITPNFKQVVKS